MKVILVEKYCELQNKIFSGFENEFGGTQT